ncbi:hypothetical protein [Chromohalobacter nigrandesensis]|uniref:hypothetical protein n=1 Tax=Chromohalobacter nigrandesensis TaxID=119863 RepID=UPI001FF17507|nr:hypothetical protein [Chromohalobacter nigrandesensis]MCK0746531.1 hypothetical protein [Chromohalobacter nigrandesensis]
MSSPVSSRVGVGAIVTRADGNLLLGYRIKTGKTPSEPQVTEPDVFSRWAWFPPLDLPTPLFPASDAVFSLWKGIPGPEGWHAYSIL